MASLYRKTTSRKDPATGNVVRTKSKKWWIKYRDADGVVRRIPGFTDKAASLQHAAALEREAERGKAGLRDPHAHHRTRPLTEHVADFERHLTAKGNTSDQVKLLVVRVRKLIEGCGFRRLADVAPGAVEQYLARLREGGASIQTSNHYLRAIKQFLRWLVLDRRATENPLAHLAIRNVAPDRRRTRRPLTPDEVSRLIEATEASPAIWGMTGRDRAVIYLIAAYTGFRRGEINSITPRSFDLAADPPTLIVRAAYSKRRREDRIPLRADLAVYP